MEEEEEEEEKEKEEEEEAGIFLPVPAFFCDEEKEREREENAGRFYSQDIKKEAILFQVRSDEDFFGSQKKDAEKKNECRLLLRQK